MKNANGKGDSYRKINQKQYDKNYDKIFNKNKSPDILSQEMSQDVNLLKGLEEAKQGKFSKNPPKIKSTKKKN